MNAYDTLVAAAEHAAARYNHLPLKYKQALYAYATAPEFAIDSVVDFCKLIAVNTEKVTDRAGYAK